MELRTMLETLLAYLLLGLILGWAGQWLLRRLLLALARRRLRRQGFVFLHRYLPPEPAAEQDDKLAS